MYEVELAAYTEIADTIMSNYEDVFNINYGEKPEVKIATIETFKDMVANMNDAMGLESTEYEIESEAFMIYMSAAGVYDDFTHTVYVSDRVAEGSSHLEKGEFEYVLAHELAHGFQFNNGARKIAELMQEQFDKYGKDKVMKDDLTQILVACNTFPEMAQTEGMAEYMAYNMFLETKDNSEMEADAFKYAKKNDERYNGMKELYSTHVKQVQMLQEHAETGELSMNDLYLVAPQLMYWRYSVGYGMVEQKLEEGETLLGLLHNPPRTLAEMLPKEK